MSLILFVFFAVTQSKHWIPFGTKRSVAMHERGNVFVRTDWFKVSIEVFSAVDTEWSFRPPLTLLHFFQCSPTTRPIWTRLGQQLTDNVPESFTSWLCQKRLSGHSTAGKLDFGCIAVPLLAFHTAMLDYSETCMIYQTKHCVNTDVSVLSEKPFKAVKCSIVCLLTCFSLANSYFVFWLWFCWCDAWDIFRYVCWCHADVTKKPF